jgi:hypothetical protein
MSKSTSTLPAPLAQAVKRFERWRKTRTKPKIPDQLWDLAAKLARKYGVNRTATPLHLDYYDLKRRAEALPPGAKESKTAASFVEVIPSPASRESACLVEIEDPRGAKMRIHLKAAGAQELEALGQLFWRNGS